MGVLFKFFVGFLWKKTPLRRGHLSTDFKKEQMMWVLQEQHSRHRQRYFRKTTWKTGTTMRSQHGWSGDAGGETESEDEVKKRMGE